MKGGNKKDTPIKRVCPLFKVHIIMSLSARQIGIYLSSLSFLSLSLFSQTVPKHKKVEPKHRYNAPIPLSLIKLMIAQM